MAYSQSTVEIMAICTAFDRLPIFGLIFHVLKAIIMKIAELWNVAPCFVV